MGGKFVKFFKFLKFFKFGTFCIAHCEKAASCQSPVASKRQKTINHRGQRESARNRKLKSGGFPRESAKSSAIADVAECEVLQIGGDGGSGGDGDFFASFANSEGNGDESELANLCHFMAVCGGGLAVVTSKRY